MKKKELEKRLQRYGWYFYRHGGCHDIWTNGDMFESIPRHNEIGEALAKKILKKLSQILQKTERKRNGTRGKDLER